MPSTAAVSSAVMMRERIDGVWRGRGAREYSEDRETPWIGLSAAGAASGTAPPSVPPRDSRSTLTIPPVVLAPRLDVLNPGVPVAPSPCAAESGRALEGVTEVRAEAPGGRGAAVPVVPAARPIRARIRARVPGSRS